MDDDGFVCNVVIPLSMKITNAIVADYLSSCGLDCTLSIFLPESGTGSLGAASLSKNDVLKFMNLGECKKSKISFEIDFNDELWSGNSKHATKIVANNALGKENWYEVETSMQ